MANSKGKNSLSPEARAALRTLAQTARKLQGAEARVDALRRERNEQIHAAVMAGAKERDAAEKAGVTPSYAHRTVVSRGNPPTGWNQDEVRKGPPRRAKASAAASSTPS
jgi:hypothetical protein